MTKRSSLSDSGRERRGPVREGYKVITLLLKPGLGLFGLVGRRRILLPHPGSATDHRIAPWDHHTLQHIQVHFGVDFQADFEDVRWHGVALTWNHTKDHNRSRKLCFHHFVIRGNPDLHFDSAGNGPVVITWIGREYELYSGASPIWLVEHCVTFRHDRRLLSLLGSVHNWPTCRWSTTKKKTVFIKRKWNHVIFSRATILPFHPVFLLLLFHSLGVFARFASVVEYTDCNSAEGKTPPQPTRILDMTLNNILAKYQWCWSFREYRALLHCHCSQVHSGPEFWHLYMGQIELNCKLMLY